MSLMLDRVHSAGREGGQHWGGKIGDRVRRKAIVVMVGGIRSILALTGYANKMQIGSLLYFSQ